MKIHCEPGFDCRGFMTADWLDENGLHVFHERTYWTRFGTGRGLNPLANILRHLANPPTISYWMTNHTYFNQKEVDCDALLFGFRAQEGFYCEEDNLHWFPIFYDWDKVLAFLFAKQGVTYEPETEPETP